MTRSRDLSPYASLKLDDTLAYLPRIGQPSLLSEANLGLWEVRAVRHKKKDSRVTSVGQCSGVFEWK